MAYKSNTVLVHTIVLAAACLMSHLIWAGEQPLKILAVHYPPYEFDPPSNGLKGFDVEVVETTFQVMGHPAEVEFLPWQRAVETVYAGNAMGLLTCARDESRYAHLYYSDVISVGTDGYFLRNNYPDPNFESIEEFRGKKIGAVRGYTPQLQLENINVKHTLLRTDEIALNVLIGGRVDIYYSSKEGNEFIANQLGVSGKIKFHPLKSKNYYLCFSKKWPKSKELLMQFNEALAKLKADGRYKQIHDKYR